MNERLYLIGRTKLMNVDGELSEIQTNSRRRKEFLLVRTILL